MCNNANNEKKDSWSVPNELLDAYGMVPLDSLIDFIKTCENSKKDLRACE